LSGGTFLLEFVLKEFENFEYQYKDDHARAYIIRYYIIYANNNKTVFKVIPIYKADLKKQRSLIPVVKYLLFNIDVDMVELGATNLIRSGDLEVINTVPLLIQSCSYFFHIYLI
jgi:hypothetical protein